MSGETLLSKIGTLFKKSFLCLVVDETRIRKGKVFKEALLLLLFKSME